MRIAEINDIASVASEITAGLRARGHDVTLFQPKLVGGTLPWTVKPAVAPVRLVEWAQLIRAIRAGNFDAVHIHYAYLGMVGVLGRFPYILHCHGSDLREPNPVTRPLTERAVRDAFHVFYSTPDLAELVLPLRTDAEFLANPVDSLGFAPTSPAELSRDVFICCALDDIKGAPRLLDACKRLAKRRPDIRITGIAGGEYTAAFQALPNVKLIPRQKRSHLPEVIGQHGVVIGQVLLGVVGMAELEAMACARPVVAWYTYDRAYATRAPIVRAVDGHDIAAAVERLVDDPSARKDIGERSRAWVQQEHDLTRVAGRIEEVAIDLERKHPRSPAAKAS